MLDTNNFNNKANLNNNINIKPISNVILQKSHPYSFFEKFHVNSKMVEWIFNSDPC